MHNTIEPFLYSKFLMYSDMVCVWPKVPWKTKVFSQLDRTVEEQKWHVVWLYVIFGFF